VSLRSRLVSALLALLAVGLAVYGLASYRAFAGAELDRLDEQTVAALPLLERELLVAAGVTSRDATRDAPPGQRIVVVPGTYAELRDADGDVVVAVQAWDDRVRPDLTGLDATDLDELITVPTVDGDGSWRVVTSAGPGGSTIIAAVPMTTVEQALARLLAIEVVAGAALLVVFGLGANLVLRSGLRPLERIAGAARSITAGSLDQRVPTPDADTEVREVAVALNSMLDDLETAFREREATEATLRRFLADASHELRTPLTSIQGYAELFRLGRDDDEVDLDLVARRIEDESARMRTLVEDLLALARLDEGASAVREPVDLTVLAADTCHDALAIDPGRRLDLDAPARVVVSGDPRQLRQAVGNLVVNAVRHTPAEAPVEVSVATVDGRGVVRVRDHGDGLPAEDLPHVFDRFWQGDPSRTGAGSGLGLSIVRAVAHAHGGEVEVANAPDGGAVFTLAVPLEGGTDREPRALPREAPTEPADAG
jgi:two-component system, OmpR family, sensor kinase